MPMTLPASSTSSFCACGTLPRPGISIMLPAIATTNPAPADSVTSLMVSVHPDGAPIIAGAAFAGAALAPGEIAERFEAEVLSDAALDERIDLVLAGLAARS